MVVPPYPRTILPTIKCQDRPVAAWVTRFSTYQARVIRLWADKPRASKRRSLNPPVAGTGSLDSGSDNMRAARHGTRATEQGSLDLGADTRHASQQGSLNPTVAGTGSFDSGSDNTRAVGQEARSTEQGSLDSGELTPLASRQWSHNPPVAGTDNQRVANGSSVSLLPQAPEAAGIAEYIVLAEAVAQDEINPAGPEDPHSTKTCLSSDKSPYTCYGGIRDQFRLYMATGSVGSGDPVTSLDQ